MTNKADWMDYIQNPKSYVLKKYIHDLLKDRYGRHLPILERLSHYLVTENDIKEFGQLAVDLYETAYMKAVEDHKEALAKAGFKATIVPPKNQVESQK